MKDAGGPRYWIGVVSKEHVDNGVRAGFAQLGHGKAAPVRRLRRGDWLLYYSPRERFRDGEVIQAFTALGEILDDAPAQVEQTPEFHPFRRAVRYLPVRATPIRPLLHELSFTRDNVNWGASFRRGSFEITAADFAIVARAMKAPLA